MIDDILIFFLFTALLHYQLFLSVVDFNGILLKGKKLNNRAADVSAKAMKNKLVNIFDICLYHKLYIYRLRL